MRRNLRIAKYVAVAALWSATGASGSSDYRAEQPPIGGPAGAASVCVSWYGTSAAVAVCQPVLLRAAIRDGTISVRIKPNVRIPGFHGRIVAAKGITQAIGQALAATTRATISGPLQARTEVVAHVRDSQRRWVVLFKVPQLAKGRTARLSVRGANGRPSVTIAVAGRTITPSYFAIEE